MVTKIKVLDLETTMDSSKKFSASPHDVSNSIIVGATKEFNMQDTNEDNFISDSYPVSYPEWLFWEEHSVIDVLVGHNIKFDLNYLRNKRYEKNLYPYLKKTLIWDTKLIDFMMKGMVKSSTLQELGMQVHAIKSKILETTLNEGKKTTDIPLKDLSAYVKQDVEVTSQIYRSQQYRIEKERVFGLRTISNFLNVLAIKSNALKALSSIECEGMYIDSDILSKEMSICAEKLAKVESLLTQKAQEISEERGIPSSWKFIPGSNKSLNELLLENNIITIQNIICKDKKGDVILYKTGKKAGEVRTKKTEVICPLVTYSKEHILKKYLEKREKGYSFDSKNINTILTSISIGASTRLTNLSKFLTLLLEWRKYSKLNDTYFQGLCKNIYAHDSCVHTNFHQTVTKTGRLSSSSPNLQNIANTEEVQKCFTSRWGAKGKLVIIDWKQLELYCVAALSGDKQLIKDLKSGKDIHREVAEARHKRGVTEEERKKAKRVVFGILYGSTANGINYSSPDISLEDAKEFVRVFYSRYEGLNGWQSHRVSTIITEGLYSTGASGPCWVHQESHGSIMTYPMDTRRGMSGLPKFSMAVNYPVQGLAAEFVQLMLYEIYILTQNPEYKQQVILCNTIHDSYFFDIHDSMYISFMTNLRKLLDGAKKLCDIKLYDMPLDLPYSVSVGLTWSDQKEIYR